VLAVLSLFLSSLAPAAADEPASYSVRMVVIMTRHGVRTATHPTELQPYAAQPWPTWEVKPGYLTPHGEMLMTQFGTHYRKLYASMPNIGATGCPQKGSVYVWADLDQRTLDTGKALMDGFAPGCNIEVHHASGNNDVLFDPLPALGKANTAESSASILGAVGGDLNGMTRAYRAAFAELDDMLGCAGSTTCKQISTVPTDIDSKSDDGLAGFKGGLDLAADAVSNTLLAYTDGRADAGWGKVDSAKLIDMLQISVAAKRLEKSRYNARAHSSNILTHILQTLQEGATGGKVSGTMVPPHTGIAFIVGHDTQLAEFGSMLGLSWILPGDQRNDTPPGGAMEFELHSSSRASMESFVRLYFTAQSIEDQHNGVGQNPARVPVYIPGCPSFDCPLSTFAKIVNSSVDPKFTAPWQQ
jgi:4-phytase/acid phosphatase